jgi:poly(3-hydroxybutyrate) depolymerase
MFMKWLKLLLFVSFVSAAQAQVLKAGPQVLSFHSDVDDTEQPYACYVPKNYNPKKAYPFVVMLHGAGSNHRLAMRRVFGKSNFEGENDVEASLYFPEWKEVEYIVATPLARGTMGYQGVAEKDVWDMIADVKSRFSIDPDRTYLTGLSMGGGGTLWLGLTRPDFWAAIAPVCPAAPAGVEKYIDNAFNYPVHFFQGGADPVVKPEGTRKLVEDFKSVGSQVEYVEYPGVLHDSWVNAYDNGNVFTWFSKFKRNPYPEKVKLSTAMHKYNTAFWMKIEDFKKGNTAKIEAGFEGKNNLVIKTENVDAFSLDLTNHPSFSPKQKVTINVDGQVLSFAELKAGHVISRSGNSWQVIEIETPGLRKTGGSEGPMFEVVSDRHIYVYGTGGNPGKDELARRHAVAQKAAEWSYSRGDFLGRVMVFPRVLSDREVRPNDIERSHLVLFGTAKTNTLIAKFNDQLPIELKDDKLETNGLAYVFPIGKKYVLVNSGLPWWEHKVQNNHPFAALSSPLPAGNLAAFGDWVLFEKDKPEALSASSFNKNWKISPEDAKKLKNTDTVILK